MTRMESTLLVLVTLAILVAHAPTAEACSPPSPPAPFAIPRTGESGLSTATTIVVVSARQPSWIGVTAGGTEVPTDGVELIGRSPNGTFAYWKLRGPRILKASTAYVVTMGKGSDVVELTRFSTGPGYDKKPGKAPKIASLALWRVRYPVDQIGSGNCVFREYHPTIELAYQAASVPDTPARDVLYVLRLSPKTGGLVQKVVFTGDRLFKGSAPTTYPSSWPIELDATRDYCAQLEAWGHGDLARLRMWSDKVCASVKEKLAAQTSGDAGSSGRSSDDAGCATAGEPSSREPTSDSGCAYAGRGSGAGDTALWLVALLWLLCLRAGARSIRR